jgi:hypothetical protein
MERHSCVKRNSHGHRIVIENHPGGVNVSDGILPVRPRSEKGHGAGDAL